MEKRRLAAAVAILGFLLVLGLFFWYKSFAYYTHDIHTYELTNSTENGQMVFVLDRLKPHYETVIQNNSSSDITASVYRDGSSPVLLQDDIRIPGNGEYWFESGEYAYKVLISGEDIREGDVNVEASTLHYLKNYRRAVVITMITAIALTLIWAALILAVPEKVKRYGVKINMVMAILLAMGSAASCLIFFSGYMESNLCFLALLCTVFTAALKQEDEKVTAVSPKEAFLTAGILSMSVSCLIFNMMLNSTESSPLYFFNARNKRSLFDYVITVIIFLVMFLGLCGLLKKNGKIAVFLKNHLSMELAVCGTAVTFSLLIQQEILNLAGNVSYFTGIFIMLIIFYLIYIRKGLQNAKARTVTNIFVYLSYAITITAAAISATVINFFHMGEATYDYVHHVGTYYRPMYYIINNIPAGGGVELYGHYAALYKIFTVIFGSDLLILGIITGMIGGLTAFFAIGTIHMLTKSKFLRIVGAVVSADILCYRLYLAIVPHRLLFPMMLLFYIVLHKKKALRWYSVLTGFFISMIAVFWNTETGAAVLITWTAFIIFKKAVEKEWKLSHMLRIAARAVGIILLASVMIIGLLALYNAFISGISLSGVIESIFGMLLNPEYMFAAHFNFIRWTNAPWVYIMIFLLGMTAYGISGTGGFGGNFGKRSEMPMIVSIAVMGLGQMIYFISRPEDYSIMIFPVIFCMIYLLDSFHQELESRKLEEYKRLLVIVLLFGFSCIVTQTKDICERMLYRCVDCHQLDYELLKEDLAVFTERVPENACIVPEDQEGLVVIYLCLGWEAPRNKENAEYIITANMIEDAGYDFFEKIPFGDIQYYLYRKNR